MLMLYQYSFHRTYSMVWKINVSYAIAGPSLYLSRISIRCPLML